MDESSESGVGDNGFSCSSMDELIPLFAICFMERRRVFCITELLVPFWDGCGEDDFDFGSGCGLINNGRGVVVVVVVVLVTTVWMLSVVKSKRILS